MHSTDFSQLHAAESWCNEFKVADLRVLRDLVHVVMYNVDSVSLEERAPCFKKKKKKERLFHYARNKLGPFYRRTRYVNGIPKQHLSDRSLRLHGYLQSETPLGEGLDDQ